MWAQGCCIVFFSEADHFLDPLLLRVRLTSCITCGPGWRGPGQALTKLPAFSSSIRPAIVARAVTDRIRQVHALVRRPVLFAVVSGTQFRGLHRPDIHDWDTQAEDVFLSL